MALFRSGVLLLACLGLGACAVLGSPRMAAVEDKVVPALPEFVPGMTTERQLGAATFRMTVEEDRVVVQVQVLLDGQELAREILRPGHTAARFDVVSGAAYVKGSLAMSFAPPGETSSLIADVVASSSSGAYPFRGNLLSWAWASGVAWEERITWLTPELSAAAAVLVDRNQSVRVRFTGASQPLTSVTLQIGAQDVLVTTPFQVGPVEIRSGMRLRMQPATPTQDGVVVLEGSFASSNLPDVKFSGSILTWSYPPFDTTQSAP